MSLYEDVKHFINKKLNRSDYLLKLNTSSRKIDARPLTIKHKFRLNAKDITTDQSSINDIVKIIIKKDYSKRSYAGKNDKDIQPHHGKIYRYESYRTQNVEMVHRPEKTFGVYVAGKFLGNLPDKYYSEMVHHLESTVMMSFAYVTGGPYKEFNPSINQVSEGFEPFDLTLYVQFA